MRGGCGERIRRLTAGTFLLLRALAEGVRVFAVSIIVSIVLVEPASQILGWDFLRGGAGEVASIAVIVFLTLFYTFEGGMTAVIWTDVVQMFLYVAGALLSFFVILQQIPGGWTHVQEVAGAMHNFQVFDTRFSWTQEFFSRNYSLWAGLIGGFFLTTASHGTEPLLWRRPLPSKSPRPYPSALFPRPAPIFLPF